MIFRTLARRCIVITCAVIVAGAVLYAREDPYWNMADELSESAHFLANPKIAVLPFSYVDKRKSSGGTIIAERLTTRLVKINKYKVIERQLLENVLQELHFETTGIVDIETTKRLGKVLGVEAIITGSILDAEEDRVEINARVIRTDTAEVIGTSSLEFARTWTDDVTDQRQTQQEPQQQPQQQPQEAQFIARKVAVQQLIQAMPRRKAIKLDNYCDILTGSSGDGKMDITFKYSGTSHYLRETDFSIDFDGSGILNDTKLYRQIKFSGVAMQSASSPLGLRLVGFGKNWGGAFEMSYYTYNWGRQKVKTTYGGLSSNTVEFFTDEYMKITVLTLLSGDLMLRFANGHFQPYIGMGAGMTFNFVSSQYIAGYNGSSSYTTPLSDFNVGFLYRFPMGIRYVVNDNISAFLEYRPTYNYFIFDRGILNESDEVFMSTNFVLLGVGIKFGA